MRSGELQTLRKENVDLGQNWIHVVSRDDVERTKTGESRKIPIHPALLEKRSAAPAPWYFTAEPSNKYPTGDHWMGRQSDWSMAAVWLNKQGLRFYPAKPVSNPLYSEFGANVSQEMIQDSTMHMQVDATFQDIFAFQHPFHINSKTFSGIFTEYSQPGEVGTLIHNRFHSPVT